VFIHLSAVASLSSPAIPLKALLSPKPLHVLACVLQHLDEMLAPEVGPQIDNLPRAQAHQHGHSAQRKPLDPLIRALIRISQLLLPGPQVIHLRDNLANRLLDASQFRLNRLELLARGNGVPVLGIGAYIDVELDVARVRRLRSARAK
jgi:hypothetical protein